MSLFCLGNVKSKVIRLLGNHDLMWLEGNFYYINKITDTSSKIKNLIQEMKDDIQNDLLKAAHIEYIGKTPILFIHGGIRNEFVKYIEEEINGNITPDILEYYLNNELINNIIECNKYGYITCEDFLYHEIFQAGPERGGNSIGGIFWTDYAIIEKQKSLPGKLQDIIQIVGHTKKTEITINNFSNAIAIDTGNSYGINDLQYLEISNGSFIAHRI